MHKLSLAVVMFASISGASSEAKTGSSNIEDAAKKSFSKNSKKNREPKQIPEVRPGQMMPWKAPLVNDPFMGFSSSLPKATSDQLAYGSQLYAPRYNNYLQPFLTIRRRGAKASSTSYLIPGFRVYNVQFSESGRYVLFRNGFPHDAMGYRVYRLDLTTGVFLSATTSEDQVAYELTSWSPDGQKLAYVHYGDDNGSAFRHGKEPELWMYDFQTMHRFLVSTSFSLEQSVGEMAWTAQGDFLFSASRPISATSDDTVNGLYELLKGNGSARLMVDQLYSKQRDMGYT